MEDFGLMREKLAKNKWQGKENLGEISREFP